MKHIIDGYEIERVETPTMYFFGVTTGGSAINRVFPLWAEILKLNEARLVGLDFPLHAEPELYRKAVAQIKHDPLSLGALVTTHKIDVLDAARDLFDDFNQFARLCGDLSCISKRDGKLIAHALDPLSAGASLQEILEPGYWQRTGGEVLCIGAGGSAISITYHFLTRPQEADRPRRIMIVNRSQPRLTSLQTIVAGLPPTIQVEYVLNEDPLVNDRLMASLAPGSMVINATGMGKDRPGSPITDAGIFPLNGIPWELNYRGELEFLRQALAQQQERNLSVQDGWRYFLHGWSDHIAEVFDLKITPEVFDQLAAAAEMIRPAPRS
jgi:shikimate 5-dehydrogenase